MWQDQVQARGCRSLLRRDGPGLNATGGLGSRTRPLELQRRPPPAGSRRVRVSSGQSQSRDSQKVLEALRRRPLWQSRRWTVSRGRKAAPDPSIPLLERKTALALPAAGLDHRERRLAPGQGQRHLRRLPRPLRALIPKWCRGRRFPRHGEDIGPGGDGVRPRHLPRHHRRRLRQLQRIRVSVPRWTRLLCLCRATRRMRVRCSIRMRTNRPTTR